MKTRTTNFAAALFAVLLLAGAGTASAQNSASASVDAEAKIVAGISLEKVLDLKFGSIVRSAEGGSVTLDPNSGEISYSGVTQGQNSDYQIAEFETTGENDYLYTIALPNEATLTHSGGSATMMVNEFGYSDGAGVLDGDGLERFNVGATLQVGPNQVTGRYTGSFDVAVQYQ